MGYFRPVASFNTGKKGEFHERTTSPKPASNSLNIAGIIPFSATDWPGKLTVTVFTQGCPWRCTYCHNPSLQPLDPTSTTHTMSEVHSLLRRRRALIDALVISGGEPLAQNHLDSAIASTHALGFEVGLHTCGYAPKRLEKLINNADTCPDWIGIDVKGLPQDMPAVVGCSLPVAESAWRCLEMVCNSRIGCQVRTTLWPGSVLEKHLDELRERVADLGHELVVQWARNTDKNGNYQQPLTA